MTATPRSDAKKEMISVHRCSERWMVPLEVAQELEIENATMRQALDEIHTDAHCAAKAGPLSIPTLDVAWRRFNHISVRATAALVRQS